MDANDIKNFLAEKYSKTYAFFKEFRPFTGFAGNVNQIDAIAVGLYDKDDRIIAFEIKTDRADFLKDVSQFKYKHRFALGLSHEFYYVCPWGLIDKNEVPAITGLLYINKGNKPQKIKQAQRRELDCIPLKYFQSFARNFGTKIEHFTIPIKWMGREISQAEFKKEIEEEIGRSMKYQVSRKVAELVEEKIKNEKQIIFHFDRFIEKAGSRYLTIEENAEKIIKVLIDGFRHRRIQQEARDFIREIKRQFDLQDTQE